MTRSTPTDESEPTATPLISDEHRGMSREADYYGYRGEPRSFWRQYLRDSVIAAVVIVVVVIVVLLLGR
jgi:hypothetical protein